MSFFGTSAPPPPPRPLPRGRDRYGVPENVVPGAVGVSVLVGKTADTAVFVTGMAAHPNGLQLTVVVVLRLGGVSEPDLSPNRGWRYGAMIDAPPFGVKFADGRRAAVSGMGEVAAVKHQTHHGQVITLFRSGGSGTEGRSTASYWLSPLPPPGPLTFVTEFRERGLAESEASIDAQLILDAAARSVELWPTGPALPSPGPAPADEPAATDAVERVFTQAFTGGQEAGVTLAAVETGEALRPTVDRAAHNFPDAVRTSRPTVGGVVFVAPDRAAVRFGLSYQGGMNFEDQIGYAVFVDGEWKVARETYCMVMSWAGAYCPPDS